MANKLLERNCANLPSYNCQIKSFSQVSRNIQAFQTGCTGLPDPPVKGVASAVLTADPKAPPSTPEK